MSSNGSVLTDEIGGCISRNMTWIRFSVNAISPDVYGKIHGVRTEEINRVLANIEKLVKIKQLNSSNVNIGVQLILVEENLYEIEGLAKKCKEIGVDNLQVKPCHNHPKSSFKRELFGYIHDGLADRLQEMSDDRFKLIIRNKSIERTFQSWTYNDCAGCNFYGLIAANGDVVPCNVFYGNQEFVFGNIYKNSLKDIWFSDRKLEVLNKIKDSKHKYCGDYRCRLDSMNRYLHRVLNKNKLDMFI